MRSSLSICVALVACLASQGVAATNLDWATATGGGGISASASYRVECTVGQPVTDPGASASFVQWAGVWAAEAAPPVVVAGAGDVKSLPLGSLVSIAGRIASSATGDFSGFFYVQDPGRNSGIRVALPPSVAHGLARGSVVNIIGALDATADGERQISGPVAVVVASTEPPRPLGMPNQSLGGAESGIAGASGLNNVGLLVRTWGKVMQLGEGYVLIDDGKGPVRVDTTALATQPEQDSYITVVGVCSLYQAGYDRVRLILPRDSADLHIPQLAPVALEVR